MTADMLPRGQETWALVPLASSVTLSNSPDLSEVHFCKKPFSPSAQEDSGRPPSSNRRDQKRTNLRELSRAWKDGQTPGSLLGGSPSLPMQFSRIYASRLVVRLLISIMCPLPKLGMVAHQ